jgi:glycosyltransferase involved in cell wall biosynthesis
MRAFNPSHDPASPRAPVEPLRLAWIVDSLMTGGAERLVVTFATEAARRSDVRLTVVALNDRPGPFRGELEALGTDVVVLSGFAVVDPRRFLRLLRALRSRRIECVHAHLNGSIILGSAAARLTGAQFAATLHNIFPSGKPMSAGRSALYRWAMRAPGARIIACGSTVADAARAECVTDLIVIPNAVSTAAVADAAARAETRAELGVAPEETLLLAVGRLVPQKAHPDLIDAFALAAAGRPDIRLAIAGAGPEGGYGQMLADRIAERGLAGRARLLGLRPDVPRLLAAADLFVSASQFEGAPVSLLEAMANGLPCVMTDVGDNRLVLEGTGCPTPPPENPAAFAAALAEMLDDPGRRAACGAAARIRAQTTFGVSGWVDRPLALYADGAKRRGWRAASALGGIGA